MIPYKYGNFVKNQVYSEKEKLRKDIFFLLIIADPKTRKEYENYDIKKSITSILYRLDGMNSLFDNPPELIEVSSLLERALIEVKKDNFDFGIYRKLILDAGGKINHFKEV